MSCPAEATGAAVADARSSFERFLLWERSSRDTLEVKRTYVDMAGDLVAGIMLSQIVYWHLPDGNGHSRLRIQHDGQLWLAKARTEWWDECRITPKQADRALQLLRDLNLIETRLFRFNGAPTVHIRLNRDAFMKAWEAAIEGDETQPAKSQRPDFPQTGKTILPKQENRTSPKGEIHLPETVKTLTEITTETTTETTTTAAPSPKEETPQSPETQVVVALIQKLTETGVTRLRAENLIHQYGTERVQQQLDMLPYRVARDSAAVLVRAIEENWAPPAEYREKLRKEEEKRRARQEAEERYRRALEKELEEARQQALRDEWWARQDPEEQIRLTEEADRRVYEENPGLKHMYGYRPGSRWYLALRQEILNRMIDERMKEEGGDGESA